MYHTPLPSIEFYPSHHPWCHSHPATLCPPQMPQRGLAPATCQEAGRCCEDAGKSSGSRSSIPHLSHCQETCTSKACLIPMVTQQATCEAEKQCQESVGYALRSMHNNHLEELCACRMQLKSFKCACCAVCQMSREQADFS